MLSLTHYTEDTLSLSLTQIVIIKEALTQQKTKVQKVKVFNEKCSNDNVQQGVCSCDHKEERETYEPGQ